MRTPQPNRGNQQGSVAATVHALPRGARPSEVWKGAAFAILRLSPTECDALAELFSDEEIQDERRVLILDLLAGAGTFEAQVVMRRVLALSIARRNNRTFATYVQRLGSVEEPDGPTLRFLMSVYAESRTEPQDVRASCSYALGAAAGHARIAGDSEAALRASDVLRRDLLAAGTAPEKAALVAALGNVGIGSDVAVLLRFANDAEPSVRAAVGLALRKTHTREAKGTLLSMLADSDRTVAQSALIALFEQKLHDEEVERLAELVLAGRTALALDGRILRLLVAQRPKMAATSRPSSIENALRLLLGRVEAAVEATSMMKSAGSGEHRIMPLTGQNPIVRPPTGEVAIAHHPFPSALTPTNPRGIPTRSQSSTPPPLGVSESGLVPRGHLPASGEYRRAQSSTPPAPAPTDTPDANRERLLALGLDPNAHGGSVPPPPPTRMAANGAERRSLAPTRLPSPAAIVRRRH